MKSPAKQLAAPLAAALLLAFAGCHALKRYPDSDLGWHNSNFSVIFGRLQRIPAKNPDDPPVWLIRFGNPGDQYHGELAVTPPEALTGYTGGEQVEIHGTLRPDLSYPDYAGSWYQIQSIRLWSPHR